jgi:hypothetical protein
LSQLPSALIAEALDGQQAAAECCSQIAAWVTNYYLPVEVGVRAPSDVTPGGVTPFTEIEYKLIFQIENVKRASFES